MLCTVIKGPTIKEAYHQIQKAQHAKANLVELRLDFFEDLNISSLKNLRSSFSIPMIFTLREKSQGGSYRETEEARFKILHQIASLKPNYLDIESHVPDPFFTELSRANPEVKFIVSFHDFTQTPKDLDALYHLMKSKAACYYKIAVHAAQSVDAIRFMEWVKKGGKHDVIAVSMGVQGQISRILAPIFGSKLTYAALEQEQQTAPGQLTIHDMNELYSFPSLHSQTKLYGLIGDPVEQSISAITHNHLIRTRNLEAVYVKMQVKPSELPEFVQLAKKLHFNGLSVTMPLKEAILPFLDEIDPQAEKIGAVNTLVFEKNGNIKGYNTDAPGALNALEAMSAVKGKQIILIGAGGAAKAIAYEAFRRGANVTILNRSVDKAHHLARSLNCQGDSLEKMSFYSKRGYDILINSTPIPMPIDPKDLLEGKLVMDIKTRPKETLLLEHARKKGCQIVYGYQMFVEQAVGQFLLWFKDSLDASGVKSILEQKALSCL